MRGACATGTFLPGLRRPVGLLLAVLLPFELVVPEVAAAVQSSPTAAVLSTIPPLPEVSGDPAGYLAGSFAVSETGAATYEIPLAVPPGTGGMAPELKLVYESGGAHGSFVGAGWSLEGLSAISRCPMTLAQDGRIDNVDFDDDDRFCLDGKRLLAVTGTYGFDGTDYRTENESFARVVSRGAAGHGPERFVVQMKSGLTYRYGANADSRFEAQGRAEALLWQLDRIEDTVGNYLSVSYFEDAANGETYPLRIDYTGNDAVELSPYNSVELEYEPRPDTAPGYVAGSLLRSTKRLKTIRMKTDGDVAWEYHLTYELSPSTGRSRLTAVEECGADGSCLAPTVFAWSNEPQGSFGPELQAIDEPGGWNDYTVLPGDYNGDGVTDLAEVKGFSAGYKSGIHLGRGDGTFLPVLEGFNEPGGWNGLTFNTGDFNGDGRTDLSAAKADANGYRAWINLSRGDGTFRPVYEAFREPGGWNDWKFLPRDYNGDGLTDYAAVKADANGYRAWLHLARPDGTFQPGFLALNEPGSWNQWRFRPVDYNGDGRTDFAAVKADANGYRFWINLAEGDGMFAPGFLAFNEPGSWLDWTFQPGDFNGDGLTDFAAIKANANGYRAQINLARGDGTFAPAFEAFHEPGAWNDWSFFQEDFNGDGRTDFGAFKMSTSKYSVWINLSRADGSFEPSRQVVNETGNWSEFSAVPGDYNGDGKTDLIATRFRPNGGGYDGFVHLAPAGAVSQLVKVTTGLGAATTIEYQPLTNPTLYRKDGDAVYPAMDVQGPLYVVSAYSQDNGIGAKARMRYHYSGLKVGLDGRGFYGFGEIVATDETTGLATTTRYRQDHPFESLPFQRQVHLADGTLVHQTVDTWAVTHFAHGGYFPHVRESLERRYEIDGNLVDTTTTTRAYDEFGNATSMTVAQSDDHKETTVSQYANDVEKWFLGRLVRAEVTGEAPGQEPRTRVSSYGYDPATGLLITETTEPGHPTLWLTKVYSHDRLGNITQSLTVGGNVQARMHTTFYDARGQFAIRSVNAADHVETRAYDRRHGKVASLTGPNGLTTAWEYDAFGRVRHELRSDGTETRTLYLLAGEEAPVGAVYQVRTDSSGLAPEIHYHDLLDREVRQETLGFDGERIFIDRQYNARGEVLRISDPYFEGDAPVWTVQEYDALGRATRITAPGDRVSSTLYAGRTTTVTNPLGQTSSRTVDSLGRLLESRDALGHAVTFAYDSLGDLIEVRGPAGHLTTMEHDLRGNRTSIVDPDRGATTATYDALGERLMETDAKGQTARFSYDLLGRQIGLTEPEGTSTWTYDTRPQGIGQLASVTGPGGYSEVHSYDALGRPSSKTTTLVGESFTVAISYDALSRVSKLTDPTGFAVQNVYTDRGHLSEVRNAADQRVYWRAEAINARGQLEQFTLGNQVQTRRMFDAATGFLESVTSQSTASGAAIQDLTYRFDEVGNLLERADPLHGLDETFSYDSLNRLTRSQVGSQLAVSLAYDDTGNILFKSDVGTYTYGESGAGPHAVTSIAQPGQSIRRYGYDANGNRISSPRLQSASLPFADGFESGNTSAWGPGTLAVATSSIAYSSYDKPTTITAGATTLRFQYAPDRSLYRKTVDDHSRLTTTTYIGGLYERENPATGPARHKHYIAAGGALVAVLTTGSGTPDDIRYLHKDHLGSLDVVTDAAGAVVERLSFDAWGRRRNASDWRPANGSLTSGINRGFTGHEMLDEVGLVDMGGRVYDPESGRFLSPDPFVQAPEDSQSLNRYSYVLNNPLSYTDPSGFFFHGLFKAIKKFLTGNKVALLGAAVGIATGFWVSGLIKGLLAASSLSAGATSALATQGTSAFFAAVGGGLAGGFSGSAASTLAAGGSLSDALRAGARGGFFGAVSGGVFNQIGSLYLPRIPQILAHGAAGGVMSLAQGGKLEHGFLSSAAEAFLAPAIQDIGDGGPAAAPYRVAAAAVVGGTVEELAGGKFANGAVTAAFARMFNAEMHDLGTQAGEAVCGEFITEFKGLRVGYPDLSQALDLVPLDAIRPVYPVEFFFGGLVAAEFVPFVLGEAALSPFGRRLLLSEFMTTGPNLRFGFGRDGGATLRIAGRLVDILSGTRGKKIDLWRTGIPWDKFIKGGR
jgi:RHS repeat-associated protein